MYLFEQIVQSCLLSTHAFYVQRYNVSGVLGKQVGPVLCYIQHVNSSMGLEEICLLQAGSHEHQGGLDFAI